MGTATYTRGYGALGLNKTQAEWNVFLSELLAARDTLLTELETNEFGVGLGANVYSIILEFLTDSNGDPLAGVDIEVVQWVEGAIGVNTNTGDFGNYIQDYTVAQFTIRGGNSVDGANFTQRASNEIARNLANDILQYEVTGGENNNYRIPDIEGMGAIDAGAAASSVFGYLPSAPGDDYVPWAGTSLFPILENASGEGYDEFYLDWLLSHEIVKGTTTNGNGVVSEHTFKHFDGTYDLVTTLAATQIAYSTGNPFQAFVDAFGLNGDTDHLEEATNDFFENYYGLTGSEGFDPGGSMPFNFLEITLGDFSFDDKYVAGSFGNDSINGSSDQDVIHGGTGNDTIYASADSDLIDGGNGTDTVSYNGMGNAIVATIDKSATALAELNASVYKGSSDTDIVYNIEGIVGSTHNDTFLVYEAYENLTLDAGAGSEDELTAFYADKAVNIDVENGSLTIEDTVMSITNFEKFQGSSNNDTIKSGTGNDIMAGGSGNDTFAFALQTSGTDTITDFDATASLEKLDLSAFNVGVDDLPSLLSQVGDDAHITFASGYKIVLEDVDKDDLFDNFLGIGGNVVNALLPNMGSQWIDENYVDPDGDSVTIYDDTIVSGDDWDFLYGYEGSDTYILDSDDFPDTIREVVRAEDKNVLQLNGIASTTHQYYFDAFDGTQNDMVIRIYDGTTYLGRVEIEDQWTANGNAITYMKLDDTTIDLSKGLIYEYAPGDAGNLHSSEGVSLDDVMISGAGASRMYGYQGNDIYIVDLQTVASTGYHEVEDSYGTNHVIVAGFGSGYYVEEFDDGYTTGFDIKDTSTTLSKLIARDKSYYPATAEDTNSSLVLHYATTSSFELQVGSLSGDTLNGTSAADLFIAKEGQDSIDIWGNDTASGGADEDTFTIAASASTTAVIEDFTSSEDVIDLVAFSGITGFGDLTLSDDSGTAVITLPSSQTLRLLGVDYTALSASDFRFAEADEDDSITGTSGADTISAGIGNDTVYGGGGNDVIYGEAGDDNLYGEDDNDTLAGGAGADTLIGGLGADSLSGGDDNDQLEGKDGNDTLYGGAGADKLYGDAGADLLDGDDGNDTLYGWTGQDTLYGGAGNDLLAGDADEDLLSGEDGADTLYGGEGADTLNGGNDNDVLVGGAGNDTFYGEAGADTAYGDAGDDTIYGWTGNDLLYGGEGNDVLAGDADDDLLFGEAGNDSLYGGAGNDVVNGGEGNDVLSGEAGEDYLEGGAGADNIYAGDDNDLIIAGDGNDYIEGGAGADTINAGAGTDGISGGTGADIFVFTAASDSALWSGDWIYDFIVGTDKLDVSAVATGIDVIGAAAFSGTAGEWRYYDVSGNTVNHLDIDGDAVADFEIVFSGTVAISETDFLFN